MLPSVLVPWDREIDEVTRVLRASEAFWFCWRDAMAPDLGLFDGNEKPKGGLH